jgi:hypothetical protein
VLGEKKFEYIYDRTTHMGTYLHSPFLSKVNGFKGREFSVDSEEKRCLGQSPRGMRKGRW